MKRRREMWCAAVKSEKLRLIQISRPSLMFCYSRTVLYSFVHQQRGLLGQWNSSLFCSAFKFLYACTRWLTHQNPGVTTRTANTRADHICCSVPWILIYFASVLISWRYIEEDVWVGVMFASPSLNSKYNVAFCMQEEVRAGLVFDQLGLVFDECSG